MTRCNANGRFAYIDELHAAPEFDYCSLSHGMITAGCGSSVELPKDIKPSGWHIAVPCGELSLR